MYSTPASESVEQTDVHTHSNKALIRQMLDRAYELDGLKKLDEEEELLVEISALLKTSPDDHMQCETWAFYASVYLDRDNTFLSLEYAEKTRLLAERLQDDNCLSMSMLNLGNVFLKLRKFEDAIKYYQLALEYANKIQNEKRKVACLNNMGICYWRLKNWKLCEKYLRISLERLPEGSPHYYLVYSNIGLILLEQGDFEGAEQCMLEAMRFNRENKSLFSLSFNLSNLADLEIRRGNIDKSLEYIEESLLYSESSQNFYILSRTYRHLARVKMAQGKLEEAKGSLLDSLKYGRQMADTAEIAETYSVLLELYRITGNYREAFEIQGELNSLQNEISNLHSRAESIQFDVRWESEKKERQIQLLLKEKELSELKNQEQNLRVEQAENELKIADKTREFEAKIRRLMAVGLTSLGLAVVIMIGLLVKERRLGKSLFEKTTLLNCANSELKEANLRLEMSNREKDEILSIVAHDLRNPLSAQIGLGQILSESAGELSASEIKEYANDIVDSSSRMNEIIALLLSSNKLERGAMSPKYQLVSVEEVLGNVLKQHQFQLEQKHQTVHLSVCKPDLMIESDYSFLMQISDNLLSNAIKYSPEFCRIWLEVKQEAEGIAIIVKDEGPGISSSDIPKLFQKYSTTSNKPTAGESSIGLGLSIAKQLVDLLNGRIWYENNPNGGSQFIVFLPNSASR